MSVRILEGDSLTVLRTLPDESVHCCVTSPPYWGLRNYGVDGQIGLESSPAEFVAVMVDVFREVRRVLRDDGTLWLNLGDSYATGAGKAINPGGGTQGQKFQDIGPSGYRGEHDLSGKHAYNTSLPSFQPNRMPIEGLKPKDLVGIPWRVAFALQADGWYLRQDIIWHKPNPMPESVRDRCTKAHEYIFLLSKSERYYFDQEAMKERTVAADMGAMDGGAQRMPDGTNANEGRNYRDSWNGSNFHTGKTAEHQLGRAQKVRSPAGWKTGPGAHGSIHDQGREQSVTYTETDSLTRNKRSVWTVATQPFKEAHFATFPPALIEPCILAGCPVDGTVLDPFGGAGTTGLVADRHGRDAILIELNPEYAAMARRRITGDAPLFAEVA